MKQGFLIPVYRHGKTACLLAEHLSAFGLPIIIVDDGNDADTRTLLAQYAEKTPHITLVSLKKNSGKGGAVIAGLKKAADLGLTHVLQIDADGQHDAGKAAFFLEESAKHPDMIICGYPEFDSAAPKSRVTGRKISNFWAAVVTLSDELKDVLCGFRVYPVDVSLRAIRCLFFDKRMGFDAEIMVRLCWKKVFPLFYPIKVSYPQDGVSNFRMVRDNIRISWMFTRLCAGMLLRLPLLVIRNIKRGKKSR
ncbi:MAG: glycosyltransferase family 2 protein [Treponema sp.]|jgi:glycosyltransferase involved in cell wall biosynthesis|nr:glycosyltransferase family 2 protein [Treponema sp.]